jgi:murein DD-endopeptidase MepM/ murein hydrolase activator NlpD
VFVLLAHLRRGSIAVEVGDQVRIGDQVAVCGNSGNSTQPHLHVQVTDSVDWDRARGIPMVFDHPNAPLMPRERQIVDL